MTFDPLSFALGIIFLAIWQGGVKLLGRRRAPVVPPYLGES